MQNAKLTQYSIFHCTLENAKWEIDSISHFPFYFWKSKMQNWLKIPFSIWCFQNKNGKLNFSKSHVQFDVTTFLCFSLLIRITWYPQTFLWSFLHPLSPSSVRGGGVHANNPSASLLSPNHGSSHIYICVIYLCSDPVTLW